MPDPATMYTENVDQLTRLVSWMTGSAVMAEDIVSETFARAMTELAAGKLLVHHADGSPGERPWLTTIAQRLVYDRQKSSEVRKRDNSIDTSRLDYILGQIPDETASVEGSDNYESEQEKLRLTVTMALDQLTPEQAVVVRLISLQGMSINDCAVILGEPVTAIKARLFRARKRLGVLLDESNSDL